MKTALLISTYNWPEALELILKSISNLSQFPDEIIIADDGSKEATKELISRFQENSSVPITHIWQEDKGFRKSSILNKAVASSNCDYVIQIDGDCIIHKDFVKDHISRAEEGMFLFGSRVNIKKEALPIIFENAIHKFSFLSKHIGKRTRNLRIPLLRDRYKASSLFSSKVRGCNLSFWKKDFLEINGYNEDIEGWGREDSEMVIRLLNKGVLGKRLRYGGIVYHIYHVEKSKDRLLENELIQRETIDTRKISCFNGINKYL